MDDRWNMMNNGDNSAASSYSSSRQFNSPRSDDDGGSRNNGSITEVEYFEEEGLGRPMQLERKHSRLVKTNRSPSIRKTQMSMASSNEYFARQLPARVAASTRRHHYDGEQFEKERYFNSHWAKFARCFTCWAPAYLLSRLGRMHQLDVQQAWREKISLIFIIILLCGFVAFVTFGLNPTLCASTTQSVGRHTLDVPPSNLPRGLTAFAIAGQWYAFELRMLAQSHPNPSTRDSINFPRNRDITGLFANQINPASCQALGDTTPETDCRLAGQPSHCHSLTIDYLSNASWNSVVAFEWSDLQQKQSDDRKLLIFNGIVLDVQSYLSKQGKFLGDTVSSLLAANIGNDITLQLSRQASSQQIQCLIEKYRVGVLDKQTSGCFAAQVISYIGLFIIMSLVLVRLAMSIIYSCFVAPKLARDPRPQSQQQQQQQFILGKSSFSTVGGLSTAGGDTVACNSRPRSAMLLQQSSTAASADNKRSSVFGKLGGNRMTSRFSTQVYTPDDYKSVFGKQALQLHSSDAEDTIPYVIMLVTCYNEGRAGLRSTFDSLAATDYDDRHKLFFIVVDGLVDSGEGVNGEKLFCTDICIDLFDIDLTSSDPVAQSYVAVAEGSKLHNMAKVYAGYYNHNGHRVPSIIVAKCGSPAEQHDPKPGNRGKRDSQLILMNFISKIIFDDRMSALEYDLFEKIRLVAGVTPDRYELVLAVDADTTVKEDSMRLLSNLFQNDPQVMGACGETCIANARDSWVTAIQVYEYFISHHSAKAFESLFGGVTCLPGCFSMYRLKSPKGKDGYWVPILASPDIIEVYSENRVKTLHQKNLYMLGEDRLLSTLLLKTFPRRKMMFLPAAQCYTVVPNKFSVLLSQRRRWINSTVHNLMELVLVKDLCGTFCISMQFVVATELFSTLVLPAAIIFTFFLIYSIANPIGSFANDSLVPLMLLITILFLPAILIFVAAKNLSMFLYLFVYLAALVIWNLILPAYAYWHFDDFGWGKTRQVVGEGKDNGHASGSGKFDPKRLVMKRWAEWHKEKKLGASDKPVLASPARSTRAASMHGKSRLHQNHHRSMIFDDPPQLEQIMMYGQQQSQQQQLPLQPQQQQQQHPALSNRSHGNWLSGASSSEFGGNGYGNGGSESRPISLALLNDDRRPESPPTPSDLSSTLSIERAMDQLSPLSNHQEKQESRAPTLRSPPPKATSAIRFPPAPHSPSLAKVTSPTPPTPPAKEHLLSDNYIPPPPPPLKDSSISMIVPDLPPRDVSLPVAKPRHSQRRPESLEATSITWNQQISSPTQQQQAGHQSPRSNFFGDLPEDSMLKKILYK